MKFKYSVRMKIVYKIISNTNQKLWFSFINWKFFQVLVRLCSHRFPCEELARKDDLSLLFSAITSYCPSHNVMWRKSAAEVLVTLSRHGLTQNVIQYIHSKFYLICWIVIISIKIIYIFYFHFQIKAVYLIVSKICKEYLNYLLQR